MFYVTFGQLFRGSSFVFPPNIPVLISSKDGKKKYSIGARPVAE